MKNLKKVLAMVLAFACTFTMFASAKVYEDVQPGTEFSEAITMLSDLGIIQGKTDGKYHPEETITRAEACALIARLLTGDPNVANFGGAQNFTDVVKGSWQDSAIGYCVANDITVGVGNGKFEPNRAINDQEFLTMMVRALGYETPDVKMGYPFSYMTVANAIGLRHDTNMMANTDALRGEDAQIIYNAMFVDYAKGAKMINTTHGTSVEKYPTLAESVWGLNRAALGTWNKKDNEDVTLSNCKAHTWVIIGEAQDEENALLAYPIDDETTDLYKAEEKKHEYKAYKFKYEGDADALRGYQVELWGAGKHGDPVWEKEGDKFVYSQDWNIKAIKTVAGQTKYDYNSSMADKKDDNGEIVLNEETTLKLESVADNAKNVQHSDEVAEVVTFVGDKLNTVAIKADKDVEKALNVRNGMQFKLMDWDTDGDIDWIVVDEARYYKVENASSKRVTVTSMAGDSLKSDKDSVTETWKIDDTEKIGTNDAKKDVKIKYEVPEGLKEGDVVEVTYKVTYEGKAQLITATVKTVDADNQKLEEVGTKDGLTLTFGDEEVKVAQNARKDGGDVIVPANPQTYKDFNGEELGTEFALYKNRNGFIVYSDYATESSNYMMVLNTYGGKDTTGNRDLAVIDFVDANNQEHKDVKVSSSARVLDKDGKVLELTYTGATVQAYNNRKFDEQQVVGNVFKYWTDADGVITKMQAMFTAEDAKASTAKEGYKYKVDADRLIDNDGKYVASLEDANVIFAVKEDYIKADTTSGVYATDLKVNSSDVLATKQKDIPDIGYGDTANKALLLNSMPDKETWLGKKSATKTQFVVNTNKNGEATAAVLGVDNFNKFNAGQTKLGLVTNVSERNGGTIKAEVAFDGKIETIASAEKQDFDGIVKVFDGKDDKDVTGVDATISATGNNVFDGKKLSNVVNEGGQYAEITTDADGKLTKLVFLDDVAGNDNKLQGHYYSVSRNLVLNVSDKNLRYGINDNTRPQFFADDSKLYSTGRLEADSSGYADEAKFYTVDAKPSRHDKKYDATRLTVNAGFDNLRQSDIKVAEKTDIDGHEPNYSSNKNDYDVADLAFNSSDDLVAVYSFKAMDEKAATNLAAVTVANAQTSYKPGETVNVTAHVTYTHNAANKLDSIKVFDKDGKVVATLSAKSGSGSDTITAEWTIPQSALAGEYTLKAAYGTTVFEGGSKITVDTANTKFVVSEVQLANWNNGTPTHANNQFNKVDGNSFYVYVGGVARASEGVVGLTAANFHVEIDGVKKDIDTTKFADKGNGYYLIALKDVDFNANHNAKNMSVEVKGVEAAVGLEKLTVTTTDGTAGQGGTVSQSSGTVAGVGNVNKVAIKAVTADEAQAEVKTLEVTLTTADNKNVTGVVKDDFKVTGAGAATLNDVADKSGVYTLTFSDDIRGKTITVEVNGKSEQVVVPAAQVTIAVAPAEIKIKTGASANGQTATVTGAADTSALKIWNANGGSFDAANDTVADIVTGVTAKISNGTISLTGTVTAAAQTTATLNVGTDAKTFGTLKITVEAAAPAGVMANGSATKAGVKAVAGTAATTTYNVTGGAGADADVKVTVKGKTETGDFTQQVAVNLTGKTQPNDIADAIRQALTGDGTVKAAYNVTGNDAAIILTAKKKVAGENITLEIDKTDKVALDAGNKTPGVAEVKAVAGTVDVTVARDATIADKGNWTLTVGTKTVTVELQGTENKAAILTAIDTAVKKGTDFTTNIAGDKITLTEANGKEGTIVTSTGITVKFEK